MKLSVPQAMQTAIEHHRAGRLAQAEAIYREVLQLSPDHPEALHFLGLLAHHNGENTIAVELISKAISVHPTHSMHYNLGNVLQSQGKIDAAVESYLRALSLKSDYSEAHINLGNAFRTQGKLIEATEHYRIGLSLKPQLTEAHYYLGRTLHIQGFLDEAVSSYRKAIAIEPSCAKAHYRLGDAYEGQGKLNEAILSYSRAISLKPDFAAAHNNLGYALFEQGRIAEAFSCYTRALLIKELRESKIGLCQCARNVNLIDGLPNIRPLVIRAMSEPWVRPEELAFASSHLIKSCADIKQYIDRASIAWPTRLASKDLFESDGLAMVAENTLLLCLLENAPVPDIRLEQFLTMARLAALEAAIAEEIQQDNVTVVSGAQDEKILRFFCALARQCYINEYVYARTDEEFIKVQLLRDRLIAAIESNSTIPELWLVAIAAYFPLNSIPSVEILLDQTWPEAIVALLTQQVREPLAEMSYRNDIPSITSIDDSVSLLVKQQYEANPYPRWIKSDPNIKVMTVEDYLRTQFPSSPFKFRNSSGKIEILVAGCGTGRHAIEIAQKFWDAKILAIDLSLTSLCYAKRKTDELGLKNIEYAQADIMKIHSIGRTFDFIESSGVLHHLAEPLAGWKSLLSLLRPRGIMNIALYSECARQSVVAARSFIAEHGYMTTPEDIRRLRQDIMALEENTQLTQLTMFRDFFSLSECRDLIFHVQEHRYTLPELKQAIDELALDFIGFTLEPRIIHKYAEQFRNDPSKTNLDNWATFEAENPYTFISMYQFSVQNRG